MLISSLLTRRMLGGKKLWDAKDDQVWSHDRFEEMNVHDRFEERYEVITHYH